MKKLKKIPHFKTQHEEREFWQKADSSEYLDYSKFERVSFPNLKLTSKPITIRIPEAWVDRYKVESNRRDIPYQTLMKQVLYDYMKKGLVAQDTDE